MARTACVCRSAALTIMSARRISMSTPPCVSPRRSTPSASALTATPTRLRQLERGGPSFHHSPSVQRICATILCPHKSLESGYNKERDGSCGADPCFLACSQRETFTGTRCRVRSGDRHWGDHRCWDPQESWGRRCSARFLLADNDRLGARRCLQRPWSELPRGVSIDDAKGRWLLRARSPGLR